MSKLFTVAGTSNLEGVVKFRVANGTAKARTAVLTRSGHTDIQLQDLPKPMTKEDAIAFIGGKSQVGALTINKGPALVADINKAKAHKLKVVKTAKPKQTKKVPAAEIIEQVGLVVAKNGAPTTKSMEEIAKIKAKNLETMRKVTNKLSALREF